KSYQQFFKEQGRSPANAAELTEFMRNADATDPDIQAALASLEEGDVVMHWNGLLSADTQNDQYTLGFEASVPGSGGYLVSPDATVKLVTVAEFNEIPAIPSASDESTETP
ncbi:MAG: hypothetical protein MI861_17675, partial [Pirellulales bacterium]|nr:hypothetical protein [Pirellulales bacterium]